MDAKEIAMDEIEAAISRYANIPAEQLRALREYAAAQADELSLVVPKNLPTASTAVAAGIALKAANLAVEAGDAIDEAGQRALADSIRVGLSIIARILAGG